MKIYKKLLSALLAVCLIAGAFSGVVSAETRTVDGVDVPDGYVVVSVEAFVLGYGYILEPTYVPYTEGETLAVITERALSDAGIEFTYGGTVESGFYLTGVASEKLANGDEIVVPDYLYPELVNYYCYDEETGEWDQPENGDGMLSQMEFTYYSGWMNVDNNVSPSVGADAVKVEAGHCYRWMYSIYGWGMDIGISDGWGMFAPFDNPSEGVDRDTASAVYAACLDDERLADLVNGAAAEAFDAFAAVLTDLSSTQEDIDAAIAALKEAIIAAIVRGDVNFDGSITVTDAILASRASLNVIELDGLCTIAADMNTDETVTIDDAMMIIRASLGLIPAA